MNIFLQQFFNVLVVVSAVRKKRLGIGLATKRLRVLLLPPNDKIRNHLVANPIV